MNSRSILLVVAIVLVSGCIINGQKEIDIELNKEFKLAEGQTAILQSENINIKLTQIIYSPCPSGAECIWSGLGANLLISKLDGGEAPKSLLLEVGHEEIAFGVVIKNVEVGPDHVTFLAAAKSSGTDDTNIDSIFDENTDITPPAIPT